ncbi:MAG: hypothetical protein V4731_03825 [Pseudomonadota bacterium]
MSSVASQSTSAPTPTTPLDSPLARALDQSDAVQEVVAESAAELLIINTVLSKEIPPPVKTGEVAQALVKTAELESRIGQSAEELAEVNELLKQELSERAELERKLAESQAALARAGGRPIGDARA